MPDKYLYTPKMMLSATKRFVAAAAIAALISLALCRCARPTPEEVAGAAAATYCSYLVRGDYESYVDGFSHPSPDIPDGYREQLIANVKMFAAQQRTERGGISEARLLRCTADTATHTADAYVLFCYGDSTTEEVLVPMVEHNGLWLMR